MVVQELPAENFDCEFTWMRIRERAVARASVVPVESAGEALANHLFSWLDSRWSGWWAYEEGSMDRELETDVRQRAEEALRRAALATDLQMRVEWQELADEWLRRLATLERQRARRAKPSLVA